MAATSYKLFLSYKTGKTNGLTKEANFVKQCLSAVHDVWMDVDALKQGEEWNRQIYEAIPVRDLLVLVLAKETAESDWVRREVDVARGAGVEILPVMVRDDFDIPETLKKFDLDKVQLAKFLEGSKAEAEDLLEAVAHLAPKTRETQKEWLTKLMANENRPVKKSAYSPPNKSIMAYSIPGYSGSCTIHVAGGDITTMKNIDVLVNPENSYMQMARVFENNTISSKVRLGGSRLAAGGHLIEDTLQQELYRQVTENDDYHLPINIGCAVPTSSGYPKGELARRGYRYVFHVMTVNVNHHADNALVPVDNPGIEQAVKQCLALVLRVNEDKGALRPDEAPKADYKPIESIILPLLATGPGKRDKDVETVAQIIVHTLVNTVCDPDFDALQLKTIHVCGYSQADVEMLMRVMDAKLKRL